VFDGDFHIVDARILGGKHLKMQLRAADGPSGGPIEAIAFGYVGGTTEDPRLRPGARVQLAYRLEVNEYRGSERVQLNCQHVRLI
jgi:single-stranded-DNA-specific exonuclease